jgi:hypothetical protein
MRCFRHFVMSVAASCLLVAGTAAVIGFTMGGCHVEDLRDPNQYQGVDQALTDANDLLHGLQGLADSPAGALIPPPVRTVLELLGFGAAAILTIWQKLRTGKLTGTLVSVLRGVERSSTSSQKEVKANVLTEMQDRGIETQARPLVRELKGT